MVRVRRVSIGSAFKVTAVGFALLWVVFGLLFVLFAASFPSEFTTTSNLGGARSTQDFGDLAGASALLVYLCGIPLYAIFGGIAGALYAFIYNLVAGWIGGLELELEGHTPTDWDPLQPGKPKREL